MIFSNRSLMMSVLLIVAVNPGAVETQPSARAAVPTSATKLSGGPLAFRATGRQHVPAKYFERAYHYVFVWKLDRNLRVRIRDSDRARGIESPFGRYSVLDDVPISGEGGLPFRIAGAPTGCLASYVDGSIPSDVKKLDAVKTGAKLRVRLQPTNQTASTAPAMLGKVYVEHATMRESDVLFRDPTARKELTRIGCDLHGRRLKASNSS